MLSRYETLFIKKMGHRVHPAVLFALARTRGVFNFIAGRDWRCCYGLDVKNRTKKAYSVLFPDLSPRKLTLSRFIYQSIEEFQTATFRNRLFLKLFSLEGAEHVPEDKGAVLISFHTSNMPIVVSVISQKTGRSVSPLAYNLFRDPAVPTPVKKYFGFKYSMMLKYLNGGNLIYTNSPETMEKAAKAIEKNHLVLVISDLPDPKRKHITELFGQKLYLVTSASRLAKICGVPLIPVTISTLGFYRWQVTLHPPITERDWRDTHKQAIRIIEEQLKKEPHTWYSIDVMLDCLVEDAECATM